MEGGSLPDDAFNRNHAFATRHDAMHDRQAEASTLALTLRREEWLKDARQQVGFDADTCVRDREAHIVAQQEFVMHRPAEHGALMVPQRNQQASAPFAHGMIGIGAKIQQDPVHLVGVHHHRVILRVQANLDVDGGRQ